MSAQTDRGGAGEAAGAADSPIEEDGALARSLSIGRGFPSANVRGALWMLGSAFILTAQGAIVKHLSADLPLPVILFLRMALIAVVAAAWAARAGGLAGLRTTRPRDHLLRAVFGLGMMVGSFYAVTVLPLADATALSFTRPIWSMLTAYLAFGETVGWLGGLATLSGFGGVLVIAQPQSGIHHGMLVALAAAASSSLALVWVKRLTATEPLARILFYFAGTSLFILALPAALAWSTPSGVQLLWLAAVAGCGAAGQTMSAQAVKTGDMTVVVPMDFTRVPFAALIGYLLFGERPDFATFLGAAIILVATLVILRVRRSRGAERPDPAEQAS